MFAAWLMYVCPWLLRTSSTNNPTYRLKTRFLATTATALVRPHHFAEAAIHHLRATTAGAPLPPMATVPVAMNTVVVPHPVMSTTPATAATVRRLHLAPLVHPLMIIHHLLVAATARILTALLLVVDTRTRMLPTDMIGLGPDRLQGLMADMMSVLRHRDTGDCSSSFFFSFS